MKYKKLGDSGIDVSLICLGTMTWGEQNTQEDAFAQMDYALERGCLLYTSPSPRDRQKSRMPSSA